MWPTDLRGFTVNAYLLGHYPTDLRNPESGRIEFGDWEDVTKEIDHQRKQPLCKFERFDVYHIDTQMLAAINVSEGWYFPERQMIESWNTDIEKSI